MSVPIPSPPRKYDDLALLDCHPECPCAYCTAARADCPPFGRNPMPDFRSTPGGIITWDPDPAPCPICDLPAHPGREHGRAAAMDPRD